jgi:hypothetical protein
MKNESKIVVVPATEEEKRLMLNFITQKCKEETYRIFIEETVTEDDELDTFLSFKESLYTLNKIIITKNNCERIYFNSLMITELPTTDLLTEKVENNVTWYNVMYEFLEGNFEEIDSSQILDY